MSDDAQRIAARIVQSDWDDYPSGDDYQVLTDRIADAIRAAVGKELIAADGLAREAAALRARLDALTAALRPALEAERGATPGPWSEFAETGEWWIETLAEDGGPAGSIVGSTDDWRGEDMLFAVAAANAVRAVRGVLEGEPTDA